MHENQPISSCRRTTARRDRPILFLLLAWATVVGAATLPAPLHAQDQSPPVACPLFTSAEKRLVMEQWSPDATCERPTRTRVTDRFVGFVCGDASGGSAWCRSFTPAAESRAFDTSKAYRCIDVAVTATEDRLQLNRMREWVAPQPQQCDWDPSAPVLASEVDFDNGQVCVAGLCIEPNRLSLVGKLRLRQLVQKALRDLQLLDADEPPQTVSLQRRVMVNYRRQSR